MRATLVSLVTMAFLLGWVAGVLAVWKSWQLFHASRWIMVSGAGYVTLMLIPTMCGFACAWVATRLASFGDDRESIRQFGMDVVESLCRRLIEGGAPGLHFYTLNQAGPSLEILGRLGVKG